MSGPPRPAGPAVTIIGAGLGGLALAGALLKVGIRPRVLEQAAAFARVGTGIQTSPNVSRVLDGLGLLGQLQALASQPTARLSRAWDTGEELLRMPMGDEVRERFGMPHLLLHRGDLHQCLYQALPYEVVEFGRKLDWAEADDDGVVLKFTDGSLERAEVVVGADGVHSRVRESIFGIDDARFTGRVAYRTVYPVSLLGGNQATAMTKWWAPDRHIVIYRISRGEEVYFTTSVPHEAWVTESFSASADMDEVRAAFTGFHPEVQAVLDACPEARKWAIFERAPLEQWCSGSVALLGDSCHPMPPYMGQGGAMAMEDAVVLARCLAEAWPHDVPGALRRYEALRRPRTSVIQGEAIENRWCKDEQGSDAVDTSFVWSYNAWTASLGPAAPPLDM